ncbi:MAG: hypothetical protein HOJ15_00350 [Candidatus Jacksonbacteria bacterium]|jgi:hypothetical protein|nr:hypothetical protein [Candidatus Jacksonbacteria bacterium]MBT6955022.1 hypothetical protein [Candidatus Jacksonbacteria bacterium]MBT7008264.1 hypothetical protein [Candidatus Jacksonbacteria bacterium]
MKKRKNTKHSGLLRFFVYFDNSDKEFVGVCVELGIIKTGKDQSRVRKNLINASIGYLETLHENDLPDYLLNQYPPKQYMDIFESIQAASTKREIKKSKVDMDDAQMFFKHVHSLCPAV